MAGFVSRSGLLLYRAADSRIRFLPFLLLFEDWLYTSTYMADARAQGLPLVTTDDPDFVEHDFHAIFSRLGVLQHDTTMAVIRGMIGCVIWLGFRALRTQRAKNYVLEARAIAD